MGLKGKWGGKGKGKGVNSEKRSRKEPTMGRPRKEELRELKEEERQELKRVVKATSERIDAIKRAKALLAVAAGATLTTAGQEAGFSREAAARIGETLQSARACNPGDSSRAWPQADVYERATGAYPGRSPARTGSQKGSDGHLVADAVTGCAAQGRPAPNRRRNDSGSAARSRLQLPTHAHLVPHRLR